MIARLIAKLLTRAGVISPLVVGWFHHGDPERTRRLVMYAAPRWMVPMAAICYHEDLVLARRDLRDRFRSQPAFCHRLLSHEFVHVLQQERLGWWRFMALYLWESARVGYRANRFEQEARSREHVIGGEWKYLSKRTALKEWRLVYTEY